MPKATRRRFLRNLLIGLTAAPLLARRVLPAIEEEALPLMAQWKSTAVWYGPTDDGGWGVVHEETVDINSVANLDAPEITFTTTATK